jgi:hypothetical protein
MKALSKTVVDTIQAGIDGLRDDLARQRNQQQLQQANAQTQGQGG